jgi:hypothetical protein
MKRFVEGEDRTQGVLLPEFLDDPVAEDNPVRAIDVFVDELDLRALGFEGVVPETTGRPAYPAMVDAQHHLIVAHEVTNISATIAASSRRWPRRRKKRQACANCLRSPIAATSKARRFWPAGRRA